MKPNIEHIVTFIHVVDKGTFTGAAEHLNVSKSVVSKHVSALEYALGSELLKRTTRKLIPTEIGRAFYHQVKTIPDQVQEAEQRVQTFTEKPVGSLKVIAPVNLSASLKDEIVPAFLKEHEGMKLLLQFENRTEHHTEDEFDVIILWKLNVTDFPAYNLIPKKLFTMPIGIYGTPQYFKQHGTPKTPEDLVEHNCISSAGNRWPFKETKGSVEYHHMSGNLETTSDAVIKSLVMHHQALAYSFPFVFEEELKKGKVVSVLDSHTQVCVELYAFYHPSPYLPPKIVSFISSVTKHYHAMQEMISKRGQ